MTNKISLAEQLAGTTFQVMAGLYSVIKVIDPEWVYNNIRELDYFALIRDKAHNELTLIVEQGGLLPVGSELLHCDYQIIRFNLLQPFEGVGFIAAVSKAVAARGVNILALSAYSFDYVMVKHRDIDAASAGLLSAGLKKCN